MADEERTTTGDSYPDEVLWVHAPAADSHEGAYHLGVPRGVDVTRRMLQKAGLSEETTELDPMIYHRKGETRAQAAKRRRTNAAEAATEENYATPAATNFGNDNDAVEGE